MAKEKGILQVTQGPKSVDFELIKRSFSSVGLDLIKWRGGGSPPLRSEMLSLLVLKKQTA